MTGFRKPFGLFLSACMIWVLVAQSLMTCPCQGRGFVDQAEIHPEKRSACCEAREISSCCETENAEFDYSKAGVESSDECCASGLNCHSCPVCLSSDFAFLKGNSVSITENYESAIIDYQSIELAIYSEHCSVIDRPPERIRLARHISTTVLRC